MPLQRLPLHPSTRAGLEASLEVRTPPLSLLLQLQQRPSEACDPTIDKSTAFALCLYLLLMTLYLPNDSVTNLQ